MFQPIKQQSRIPTTLVAGSQKWIRESAQIPGVFEKKELLNYARPLRLRNCTLTKIDNNVCLWRWRQLVGRKHEARAAVSKSHLHQLDGCVQGFLPTAPIFLCIQNHNWSFTFVRTLLVRKWYKTGTVCQHTVGNQSKSTSTPCTRDLVNFATSSDG